ncbi:MAG: flagellar basal-body rod protein FlgF [Gammaproteobacteria bacterium]|nr:flagellar basal-body rod protein FlgF [Gammaproteobacteria bacterium]
MDRVMYLAAYRANQIMQSQRVNSNNLANISTTGFREDLMVYTTDKASSSATRIYPSGGDGAVNFNQGSLQSTGRQLDMAVSGEGWMAIQSADGSEAYTRAGNFRISSSGLLTTVAGDPVLGDSGPLIIPPYEKMEVGNDGTITIRPLGQPANEMAKIGRIKLVNPQDNELFKSVDGNFRTRNGEALASDASVSVMSGSLESSNVNAVSAMVNMIELARQFEVQMKVLETAKENDQASTKQLRMGN